MENNFENKKVVPIERGEEIKLEKLKIRLEEFEKETRSLYDRLVILEEQKEAQLEEELRKPTTLQNIELISLLHGDLEEIKKNASALEDMLIGAFEWREGLRQEIQNVIERIQKRRI